MRAEVEEGQLWGAERGAQQAGGAHRLQVRVIVLQFNPVGRERHGLILHLERTVIHPDRDRRIWLISNVRDTRGKIAILLESSYFSCPWSFVEKQSPLSSLLDRQAFRHIETNGTVGIDVAVDQGRKRSEILFRHLVHPGGIGQELLK